MTSIVWTGPVHQEVGATTRHIWYGDGLKYVVAYYPKTNNYFTYKQNSADFRFLTPESSNAYLTLESAQAACERHKFSCQSTTMPAIVETRQKNLNLLRVVLANVPNAGSGTDSSDKSAKCASLNLEARLSHKRLGVPSAVAGTELKRLGEARTEALAGLLLYTNNSAFEAMESMGLDPHEFDLQQVVTDLVFHGIARCHFCPRWGNWRDFDAKNRCDVCQKDLCGAC